MNFKDIKKDYRPIPFWSWNEKLNVDETSRQIRVMDKAGMGGFFMHARGGLQTEYMGEEWFSNVDAAVKAGKETGMGVWAYDENGWPSDFGVNGKVKAKITLINNLRNMLGPHHLKEGECYNVGPSCFFNEPCIWSNNPENTWNYDYCFVQMNV